MEKDTTIGNEDNRKKERLRTILVERLNHRRGFGNSFGFRINRHPILLAEHLRHAIRPTLSLEYLSQLDMLYKVKADFIYACEFDDSDQVISVLRNPLFREEYFKIGFEFSLATKSRAALRVLLASELMKLVEHKIIKIFFHTACLRVWTEEIRLFLQNSVIDLCCNENVCMKIAASYSDSFALDMLLKIVDPTIGLSRAYRKASASCTVSLIMEDRTPPTPSLLKTRLSRNTLTVLLGHPNIDPAVLKKKKYRRLTLKVFRKDDYEKFIDILLRVRAGEQVDQNSLIDQHFPMITYFYAACMHGNDQVLDDILYVVGKAHLTVDKLNGFRLALRFNHGGTAFKILEFYLKILPSASRRETRMQYYSEAVEIASYSHSLDALRLLTTKIARRSSPELREILDAFVDSPESISKSCDRLVAFVEEKFDNYPGIVKLFRNMAAVLLAHHWMTEVGLLPSEIIQEICLYAETNFSS